MKSAETNLIANAREFLKETERAKANLAFNSAVTLYFKAAVVVIDLFILKQEGIIPSNHTERFRILETNYPILYRILDKGFPIYQNSYRLKLTKDYAEELKNDFKKTIEFTKIKVDS